MTTTTLPISTVLPKSFVVELIILAATGEASEFINREVFDKAVKLMKSSEIPDFEDVTWVLKTNSCDASCVFGCDVTTDTHDAFAAYLCYAI